MNPFQSRNLQSPSSAAGHGRAAYPTLAVAASGFLAASVALAMVSSGRASAQGHGDPRECDQAICLRYSPEFRYDADSDGDGFTDDDERAAGTDPADPTSYPRVLELVDLAADGALPSFEKNLSEVVVLPEAVPDGATLADATSLESLTAALGALAPSRKDGLSRVGISADLLAEMGVTGSDMLALIAGPASASGKPAFEVRVAGMKLAQIANFESGTYTTETRKTDGSTTYTTTWMSLGLDHTSNNYTAVVEEKGGEFSVKGITNVPTKDGKSGTPQDVTDDSASRAKALAAAQAKSVGVAPPPANPQAPEPQPATAAPATTAPAAPASTPPSDSPSSDDDELTPLTPITPKPSSGYENPDADPGAVTITAGDVRRVVRLVRGSNTTPAQVDVQQPPLDPEQLRDPVDLFALRDGANESVMFTTIPPTRNGDAVTNYGPQELPRP